MLRVRLEEKSGVLFHAELAHGLDLKEPTLQQP
jgi:hypothetical protein